MLFYIYSDAPGTTIDITDRCRVGRLSVKDNAEEGSVAISNLIIDDPDGDLVITGHRRMYIYESEAPILDQVIFNGFVVNERLERGPYRTGAGRQWVIDLADPNVFINRRIMNGADANRPAETDLARIQALLTMTELNTVDDDTYVNTTADTVDMDAVDYRGQNVGQYIDDCRQQSGKNGYILYNETVGQYGLWYDFADSAVYDSGKFLTNTISEADQATFFQYSQERTHLNIDPSRVASGIYLEYDGGLVYAQDAAITAEFAAIDWAAPSLNVKTSAKATARAERYLADAASEDYIVHTVMTAVPRDQVNAVKKGQLVQFKSSYMAPWYDEYGTFRVLYRTVNEISEDPEASFEIEMDLTPITPAPGEPSFFTSVNLSGCEVGTWPEGSPPEDILLVGFLAQRDGSTSDATIVAIGNSVAPGSETCDPLVDIPGTEWTFIDNLTITNGVGQTGQLTLSYRDSEASEPEVIRWGGVGGLAGTSRPRSHQGSFPGFSGAPTVTQKGTCSMGATMTSPAITVAAAGRIVAGFLYRCTGPADGASPNISLAAQSPAVDMTQGWQYASFGGFSWFGYLDVAGAGTYDISLDRTNTPRSSFAAGWVMGFWPA